MKKLFLIMACTAMAMLQSHAVTLNVTVPEGTPACYVAGAFNNWNAVEAVALVRDGDNHFTITIDDVTTSKMAEGYKYLSGPAWKYVEKSASGAEINNRTAIGNPDVVGSWAAVYDNSIIEKKLTVNGYDRKLRIHLPADYESSGENYPVVYCVGVNQRYTNAGSDDYAGDDFFAQNSWNAHNHALAGHQEHGTGCILVSMHCHVAEAVPFAHADFAGTGASDIFLEEFIAKAVTYVNQTYRTGGGADRTTIVGGDLGGLLALYAGMTHPEVFGRTVAMSPALWLCQSEMEELAHEASLQGNYIIGYGSTEPAKMATAVNNLASAMGNNAKVLTIVGGTHDDASWSTAIPTIYPFFIGGTPAAYTVTARKTPTVKHTSASRAAADADYTFWYSESSASSLAADGNTKFIYTTAYTTKGGNVKNAQVALKDVSSSFKSKCYWNVMDNATGSYLQSTAGNVSFSSKKTARSWLRVAVFDDGSIENVAASSKGFRLVAADGTINMSTDYDNHRTSATVPFTGNDKTFSVHYGSVNSESDMGAITMPYSVSDNCLEAEIVYDFMTNTVAITETKWGASVGSIKIEQLSATPAVTYAGKSSHITLRLDTDCTPTAHLSKNYGTASALTLTAAGERTWNADISSLERGIYHISVDVTIGNVTKENIGTIAIKVIADSERLKNPSVTVNAYEGIDWATTGRYKANFHTHTSQSFDTEYATHQVVDRYQKAGYQILALTDHDYNSYPWEHFDIFNSDAESRRADAMGMLTVPAVELSKDNTNSWSETAATGDFNHHNDFFTGRKGQEFATLRQSYAYTDAIGGMQIINHPGQYWKLATTYSAGEKNSPEWHAENFTSYPSLIGLEVYNQGDRRSDDRILWDQILDRTMPWRPVWGYSCDDTHTSDQYFHNYQHMLMPELSTDALKSAMRGGTQYFSYDYAGTGEAKAPTINSICVDNDSKTISIDTDADRVEWISGTDKSGGASTRQSTVVGIGNTFDFNDFQGNYVRARLINDNGETATQPFGLTGLNSTIAKPADSTVNQNISISYTGENISISSTDKITAVHIFNAAGIAIAALTPDTCKTYIDTRVYTDGTYIVVAATATNAKSCKYVKSRF